MTTPPPEKEEKEEPKASEKLMRYLRKGMKLSPEEAGKAMDLYYSAARDKIRTRDGTLTTEVAFAELLEEIKVNKEKDPIIKSYLDKLEQKGGHFASLAARWKSEFPKTDEQMMTEYQAAEEEEEVSKE